MKISASITDYTWPGGTAALGGEIERVALAADPMLESCTALGWIAARTERIRLGTMVAAITYRPASVLIKAVTTLDVLARHCETEGRPFGAIEKTVSTRLEV